MNKFIGLKENQDLIYNNLYMEEYKIVIKLPLFEKSNVDDNIKTENFDLTRYNIFIPYE